ncbi:hypothetical protein [Hymenobacter sp. BT559]|uniref:hypothetical protein n=1 Tax=Hymenobacter sp. BT559 TaxID=2795729 RepID=UPI0018ECC939|nr:hypothetical protein [Hymenobacter sp. BT559]MBJ6144798.1 hypothetical protein [Hymenobacter sp. BT559]
MQFDCLLKAALLGIGLVSAAAPIASAQSASKYPTPAGPPRKKYMFAQKDPECPVVANITKNTDEDADITGSYTRVCYRSQAEMLAEIDELRRIHTWADSTYQRRLAALPPGGALLLTIHRQGAKNADPSALTLTARTKDGAEVYTATPKPGSGRFFGRDLYQAQQAVPFVKPAVPGPYLLSITDSKLQQVFEYQLSIP